MSQPVRAFLALELPRRAKDVAADAARHLRERLGEQDIKWVSERNLHVTLRFLGDLSPDEVSRAAVLVRGLPGELERLGTRWSGLGAFPSTRRPSVIWLGLEDGEHRLRDAAGDVERRLIRAGFGGADKPFKAHVTLGRVRPRRRVVWPASDDLTMLGEAFSISAITLFKSRLTPQGPVYTPIETACLHE